VRFTENAEIDAGRLAQFVASQKGTQFTPQGVLKFQMKSHQAEVVLNDLKKMLNDLATQPAVTQ